MKICLSLAAIAVILSGVYIVQGMLRNDALLAAATDGKTNEVVALIKEGADPNYDFEGGLTPLWFAVANGHTDTVRVLLDAGADPSAANRSIGPSPPLDPKIAQMIQKASQ